MLNCQHVLVHQIAVAQLQQALLLLLEGVEPACGPLGFPLGGTQLAIGVLLDGARTSLFVASQPLLPPVIALDGCPTCSARRCGAGRAFAQVVAAETLEVASAIAGSGRLVLVMQRQVILAIAAASA